MKKTALILAAHPDDEVLGCGATAARLASEGWRIVILILANGLESRPDFPQERAAELLRIHHERARRAGAMVGAEEVVLAGLPDQRLDT
ncbi:MAG: PIG-L family deacetylase, partial [Terrimicrobiaceae bacterium]|nr:PIG-L family deacetylase [Terrimicrobiaceae bacterium]